MRALSLLLLGACQEPTVEQHGLQFRSVQQGAAQLWLAELPGPAGRVTLPFYYLPDETADVVLAPGLQEALRDPGWHLRQLYVAVDPDAPHYSFAAGAELGRFVEDLGLWGAPKVQLAWTRPSGRPERLPVVGCPQASGETGVVLVEQGAGNALRLEGRCLRASYLVPQDSLRVADRLCYALAGVF